MIVTILNKAYQMSQAEAQGLLKVASDQVPFGIYALEQDGKVSLENIRCESLTQLKQKKREFRRAGLKVYCNGL